MIAGQLANWDKEKHLYAPAIQKAVAWLQQADLSALPTGAALSPKSRTRWPGRKCISSSFPFWRRRRSRRA